MRPLLTAIIVAITGLGVCVSEGALAWFNEFHYDNTGADTGEFIEIAVSSDISDLNNMVVTLCNGNGGAAAPPSIQNGAPDGLALSYLGALVQFLSYEGTFQATGGPADGVTSIDIGISQDGTEPVGASLGLGGTGNQFSDFSWVSFTANSQGALNVGQTITPVPEPAEWGLICAVGLLGVCGLHTWRERRRALRQSASAS